MPELGGKHRGGLARKTMRGSRRTANFVVALAEPKPTVLAAVAASSPNLPYLSRNALMVFMFTEGTSKARFDFETWLLFEGEK